MCCSHQLRADKGSSADLQDQQETLLLLMLDFTTITMDPLIQYPGAVIYPDSRLVPSFPSPAVLNGQGLRVCDALGQLKSQLYIRQLAAPQHVTPDITHPTLERKNRMISHRFSAFGFPTIPLNACWATGSLCAPEEGRMVPDKTS